MVQINAASASSVLSQVRAVTARILRPPVTANTGTALVPYEEKPVALTTAANDTEAETPAPSRGQFIDIVV